MTAGSAAGGGGIPSAGRAGTGVTTAPGAPTAGCAGNGAGRVAADVGLSGHAGSGTDDPQAASKASGVAASSKRRPRGVVGVMAEAWAAMVGRELARVVSVITFLITIFVRGCGCLGGCAACTGSGWHRGYYCASRP